MDNNQEEIYFAVEDIFDKISEILSRNGTEEDPIDAAFKKERSYISIILNLMKNFTKEKISEKDFCFSLQTQLKVSKETSENILKEIKTNILPHAEKIKIGEQINEEEPITASPIKLIDKNQIIFESPVGKRENINKPPVEDKKIKYPKEPDKYRESIE
jgi:hypothetical protein